MRRELVGSQARLSARTKQTGKIPINKMTISEIETGANADPGITTVARLVEGMGLTLSSFFARIEGLNGLVETREITPPQQTQRW